MATNSKLIDNLWQDGKLPTIDTAIQIDSAPVIKGAAMFGITIIICILLYLIFKQQKA